MQETIEEEEWNLSRNKTKLGKRERVKEEAEEKSENNFINRNKQKVWEDNERIKWGHAL